MTDKTKNTALGLYAVYMYVCPDSDCNNIMHEPRNVIPPAPAIPAQRHKKKIHWKKKTNTTKNKLVQVLGT